MLNHERMFSMRKSYSRLSLFTAALLAASCIVTGCNLDGASESISDGTTAANSADITEPASDVFINDEWSYGQVTIGGGGFVTGIVSTCEPDLFYCRTDVGGAYRWDSSNDTWVSLSCDITDADKGLLGIDGIAVDPNNAARVYLLAGTSYFSSGKTCILVSDNYGQTFTQVEVTDLIRAHGNGMGRGNGERIAVDPNNSDIIYCGGRTGGMIRSLDGGMTWESVSSFPITSTANENGINIIMFDGRKSADGKTTRIIAAVSDKGTDNIFISEDAGETWQPIPGLDDFNTEFMPQRMDLDSQGRLYVSYGIAEGPYNSTLGTLYRFDVDDGTSQEIPVSDFTVGDIVIDPDDDNRIVLVSSEVWRTQPNGANGDVFLRSEDGGQTWEELDGKYTLSSNGMDWISEYAIHWCSSLAMDSGNSNRILVNSGNGVFACDNIWDDAPAFYFESRGIEEVVPEDIVSYKDYPLVSAIGDYDGFIHEDIYSSPERHSEQIGSVTSIAIAAQNHDIWVKVGGSESMMKLLYSTDGGGTWSYITNSPEDGQIFYRGKVGLTADGSALLWSPSNSRYVYRTEDWGETWEKSEGILGASSMYIIGDNVNKDIVYASGASIFYVSTDGGKSFSRKTDMCTFSRVCPDPDVEGTVYLPGGGYGLLKTEDAGENITLVQGLKYCEAVGLGKPKNDGDPYVIYVYGTLKDSDITGLYMSEDNGETWVRINDDLHTFGGTGNGCFVSGDMNVYGRCYMSTVGLGIAYCDKNDKS